MDYHPTDAQPGRITADELDAIMNAAHDAPGRPAEPLTADEQDMMEALNTRSVPDLFALLRGELRTASVPAPGIAAVLESRFIQWAEELDPQVIA